MHKLKQELKISNLFLWGSVGLEGKMNDERMISQTPTVHKLDEVSSWCLVDCSKYVRESHWRRVNVVSHVGWSFLLLGSKVRECVLCHVDRSVLLKRPGGRKWKNVTSPFYSCPGKWPGQNGMKYSPWSKIWVWNQNSQNIPAPDNNLKFFLLQSVYYTSIITVI